MKKFFSPLLPVIFGFINVVLCAETNSSLGCLFPVLPPESNSIIDKLFPITSKYDSEIETLLNGISEKVVYLREILQEKNIEECAEKLENDLLYGNLDKVTIKKLKKLCILGVRRNSDWLNSAADSFNKTLDEGKSFNESWFMAIVSSARGFKIEITIVTLVRTILLIQIGKFTRRLREVVPVEYNLDEVNYLKSIGLMPIINEKLFEIIMENWIRNLKKLWKSQPEARPAIKSHGKFWLRFVNFSEFTNPPNHLQIQTLVTSIVKKRDSMVRNFFESPIFEIIKEEVNDWSRI